MQQLLQLGSGWFSMRSVADLGIECRIYDAAPDSEKNARVALVALEW